MKDDLQAFAGIIRPQLMQNWLAAQRETAIKALVGGGDLMIIHRAQGQVQLLDRMLDLLEKAKDLR